MYLAKDGQGRGKVRGYARNGEGRKMVGLCNGRTGGRDGRAMQWTDREEGW